MSNEVNPKPKSRFRRLLGVLLIFSAGIAFAGLFNVVVEYTNRTEFCTSCHAMTFVMSELEERVHWKSRTGVHASCADCHVPKDFTQKMIAKTMAMKELWHQFRGKIDTPEKFEAHRLDMAQRVWAKMKASDSRECRSCHGVAHMDFSEQDRFARKKHENAPDRGQTCIDCHKGIAHQLPEGVDVEEEGEGEGADKGK